MSNMIGLVYGTFRCTLSLFGFKFGTTLLPIINHISTYPVLFIIENENNIMFKSEDDNSTDQHLIVGDILVI